MIDFMFFVKMFLLTVAIVLVMQIQVDDHTFEAHAMGWVQSATITHPLNMAAHGAAKLAHDLTEKIYSGIHHNLGRKHKKDEVHDEGTSSFFWQHSVEQASKSKSESEN